MIAHNSGRWPKRLRGRRARAVAFLLAFPAVTAASSASAQTTEQAPPPEMTAAVTVTDVDYAHAPKNQWRPDVTPVGDGWFVAWQDNRPGTEDIWGTRLSQDGEPLEPGGLPIGGGPDNDHTPVVAAGNGVVLVLWESGWRDPSSIRGALVAQSGEILHRLELSTRPGPETSPAVLFDGKKFTVIYENDGGTKDRIVGTRVSTSGELTSKRGYVINRSPGWTGSPAVARVGRRLLVTWSAQEGNRSDLYATRLMRRGAILDPKPFVIANAPDNQRDSAVASNGASWLVVWEDRRNYSFSYYDVYATRVGLGGEVLDPNGFSVAGTDYNSSEKAPDVSWSGGSYTVAWTQSQEFDTIRGRRVASNGELIGQEAELARDASGFHGPRLAASGRPLLIVERWPDDSGLNVDATFLTESGQLGPVRENLFVSLAPSMQSMPEAALSNDRAFIAWNDNKMSGSGLYGSALTTQPLDSSAPDVKITEAARGRWAVTEAEGVFLCVWLGQNRIYAMRFNEEGEQLDLNPIEIPAAQPYDVDVASNGDHFLIVWSEVGSGRGRAMGARISREGLILNSGFGVVDGPPWPRFARVASNGDDFFVTWLGYSEDGTTGIYGTRIDELGNVLDPGGFPVAPERGGLEASDVAWVPPNYVVVWSDSAETPPGGNPAAYLNVYGARVATTGVSLDCHGFYIGGRLGSNVRPSIAPVGGGAVVVWDHVSTGEPDVLGARLANEGYVLDTEPFEVAATNLFENASTVASSSSASDTATVFYETMIEEHPFYWTQRVVGTELTAAIADDAATARPARPCLPS